MLNTLGGGGKKGNQLIQLGGSFNSLAGTAVIILSGIMIPSVAKAQISDVFPLMYAALGIFAFAFLVLSISRIPETTDDNKAQASNKESSKIGPMSFRHFVLGAVAIFVYVGVEVGIPNVLQKWLQNGSLNVLNVSEGAEAIAGSVAATYWFLMLIGRLVGAAVGAKVSTKAMLTTVSARHNVVYHIYNSVARKNAEKHPKNAKGIIKALNGFGNQVEAYYTESQSARKGEKDGDRLF